MPLVLTMTQFPCLHPTITPDTLAELPWLEYIPKAAPPTIPSSMLNITFTTQHP